jgi:hypothetical protein
MITHIVAIYQDQRRVELRPVEVAPLADPTRQRALVVRALTEAGYHVLSVSAPAALPAWHPPCHWVATISGAPVFRRPGKPVTRAGQPLAPAAPARSMIARQRALTGEAK